MPNFLIFGAELLITCTIKGLPEEVDPGSPSKRVIDRNLTLKGETYDP
jgi:hypothetical protein